MTLSAEERAWADRCKRFIETRDYGLVSESDLDELCEFWKLGVRLHNLDLSEVMRDRFVP